MNQPRIDLIWLHADQPAPEWSLGEVYRAEATPRAVHTLVQHHLPDTQAEAWLFWSPVAGVPDPQVVVDCMKRPGDVWHAGLRLGMAGLPGLIDFVNPTWMFSCDPPVDIEASSWRLSLSACLVRTDVLRQMGGIYPAFKTIDAAALEMGHRYMTRGVFTRHVPWLIGGDISPCPVIIPFEDELRFVYYAYRRWQYHWALGRAVLSGYVSPLPAVWAWWSLRNERKPAVPNPYSHHQESAPPLDARVTVLIPTLDRYPYLKTLLAQLREQTIKPYEIIVIDQTAAEARDTGLQQEFADLPLKLIYQDEAGQCTSRNAGLQIAQGDYILFLDDDDEVENDLIELHLKSLHAFQADASNGYAREIGAGPQLESFSFIKVSDVFPTNNTLIRREVLRKSGLFDLAYNRSQRADGDLGTRIYLSGHFKVYNPAISVLHHHAPRGGLRAHRARVITYASSRASLIQRHLPSVSEIYLAKRYFSARQVHESLWLRAFGTFAIRGSRWRKILKIAIAGVMLPNTIWRIRKATERADEWLTRYPQIPLLQDAKAPPEVPGE